MRKQIHQITGNMVLVVGAGFAGSVAARVLADAGLKVRIIDRRDHLGGNAYDGFDEAGVLIHIYGPHIFHTNIDDVVRFLSRFTEWRPYEHRVRCVIDNESYPLPINRDTLNKLYGLSLDEAGAAEFLARVREPRDPVLTSEDAVLSSVGRDLYEKFFLNYTRKQWGLEPSQLKAGVAARIPVRTNTDDRYFTDCFQMMPKDGFSPMFSRMLDHPNIEICLGMDFSEIKDKVSPLHTVYTGPIDTYFNYCYGPLPYRSLRFAHEHLPEISRFQEVGTVNYPNDHAFTRITEFKHLTGQEHKGTSIVREYPQADGDPYYPIPHDNSEALYRRYEQLAFKESQVTFVGRLAQFRYYNMDQVVEAALLSAMALAERLRC